MRGNGRAHYGRPSKTAHRLRGIFTSCGLSTSPSLHPRLAADNENDSVHSDNSESSYSGDPGGDDAPPHNAVAAAAMPHNVLFHSPTGKMLDKSASIDFDAEGEAGHAEGPIDVDAEAGDDVIDGGAAEGRGEMDVDEGFADPMEGKDDIFNNDGGLFDEEGSVNNSFEFHRHLSNVVQGHEDQKDPVPPPEAPIRPVVDGVVQQDPNLDDEVFLLLGQGHLIRAEHDPPVRIVGDGHLIEEDDEHISLGVGRSI